MNCFNNSKKRDKKNAQIKNRFNRGTIGAQKGFNSS